MGCVNAEIISLKNYYSKNMLFHLEFMCKKNASYMMVFERLSFTTITFARFFNHFSNFSTFCFKAVFFEQSRKQKYMLTLQC